MEQVNYKKTSSNMKEISDHIKYKWINIPVNKDSHTGYKDKNVTIFCFKDSGF